MFGWQIRKNGGKGKGEKKEGKGRGKERVCTLFRKIAKGKGKK